MALAFEQLKKPIARELAEFEGRFRESMRSEVALLDAVMNYIVKRKGKQIRPIFVLQSARLCGGITEATYRGAALVELLHTASLVHDDVVDDADLRRGFFSINALWKNKIAVLVGDYLLSKGLLLSLQYDDYSLLKIVSEAVRKMSEGELLQIEKTRKLNITEDIYYDIINKKTASLIASCCACGAASTGADKERVEEFRVFGEKIGLAFQIKDDLLDFGDTATGKAKGVDIKEKKITLPLIFILNKCTDAQRRFIIQTIKNYNTDGKRVNEIIALMHELGGITYATSVMNRLLDEALHWLNQLNAETEIKQQMTDLVRFIADREK